VAPSRAVYPPGSSHIRLRNQANPAPPPSVVHP